MNDIITMMTQLQKKDENASLIIWIDEKYEMSVSVQYGQDNEDLNIYYSPTTGKWTNLAKEELPIYMDC